MRLFMVLEVLVLAVLSSFLFTEVSGRTELRSLELLASSSNPQ